MVQAAGANNREQIKAELHAMAQEYIGNWDNYADREFTSNEYGFDFASRQTDLNGCTLTVAKASIPGFTLDMHKNFRDNIVTMLPKLDDRLSIVDCPPVDGLRCLI